jgi:hypothetical protein
MSFKSPVWDSNGFEQKVIKKGYTFKEFTEKLQPHVGQMNGTQFPSVIAWQRGGREPSKYAILAAVAHVLDCKVEDLFIWT